MIGSVLYRGKTGARCIGTPFFWSRHRFLRLLSRNYASVRGQDRSYYGLLLFMRKIKQMSPMEKGSQQLYKMTRECFCAVTLSVPGLLSNWKICLVYFLLVFFFFLLLTEVEKTPVTCHEIPFPHFQHLTIQLYLVLCWDLPLLPLLGFWVRVIFPSWWCGRKICFIMTGYNPGNLFSRLGWWRFFMLHSILMPKVK